MYLTYIRGRLAIDGSKKEKTHAASSSEKEIFIDIVSCANKTARKFNLKTEINYLSIISCWIWLMNLAKFMFKFVMKWDVDWDVTTGNAIHRKGK